MKILSVKFKNINSLKGEHFVDFTSSVFVRNPLFAITGPTGSGKTTLLDVISLALFNEIPRLGKISKTVVEEQGAILTRGQTEAFACVNYECNQGKFSSVWNIHKAKSGRVQNHTMEIYRLETGERLDLKNNEVPGKNEQLIGLNYDQFIKSVLLAQGEFAKFLKASRKDRGQLLENITGTGIYRQIGALAFQTFNTKQNEIRDQQNILNNLKENVLKDENLASIKEEQKKQEIQKANLQKQLDDLKKEIETHSEITQLKEKIRLQNQKLTEQQGIAKTFEEEKGSLLKNHENVSLYSSELNIWKNIGAQLKNISDKKNEKEKESNNLLESLKIKFAKIKTFVKEEFESAEVEEKLRLFYDKVQQIITEKESLNHKYKAQFDLFKVELREFKTPHAVKDLLVKPKVWEDFIGEIQQEKESLKTFFQEEIPMQIEEEITKLEEFSDLLNAAILERQKIDQLQLEIEKNSKEQKNFSQHLKKLPEEIEKNELQENSLKREVENLQLKKENQILKANLEEHRHRLKEGEACPLCGSLDHPFAHEKTEPQVYNQELKQKEEQLSAIQETLTRYRAQEEFLHEQLQKIKQQLKLNLKQFEEQQENFYLKYSDKISAEQTNLSEEIKRIKRKINHLKKLKEFNLKEKAMERAQPLYEELQKIIQAGREKSKALQALYTGKNILQDVRNFEGDWARLREQYKGIKQQLDEIKTQIKEQQKTLKDSEIKLLPDLEKLGFAEVAHAVEVLLPEEEVQQLKNQIQKINEQIQIISAQLEVHKSNYTRLQEGLKTTFSVEELKENKTNLEKEILVIQEKTEDIRRSIKNDNELREKVEKLENEIGTRRKKNLPWELLNKMIGDSKGSRFNLFAQDLTLKHLLKLANKRLKGINNRYELMMLPGMPDNKDNLVIADKDMGGQQRAVQTLSGGETFLMSLGLALALSDLAAKKININSLFIDEGFGTLDPETLDQTLDTLERLQAYSTKTIGIISHVDALKERIGTQIQLSKTGQGYSEMKIISL